MTTRASSYSRERFWNDRNESHQGTGYRPLPNSHRLLQSTSPSPDRLTPPISLPRLQTPEDHRHDSKVRGSRYEIIPPVRSRDHSRWRDDDSDEDSWGEDGSSDDDDPAPQPPMQPAYPYPMMMYPMVVPVMQPQPAPKKTRSRHAPQPKKKVRYRNTPVVINMPATPPQYQPLPSREKLRKTPPRDSHRRDRYQAPMGHRSKQSERPSDYDPFDPRSNSVLDRYEAYPYESDIDWNREKDDLMDKFRREKMQWSQDTDSHLAASYRYLDHHPGAGEDYVEDFVAKHLENWILPDLAIEALRDPDLRKPDEHTTEDWSFGSPMPINTFSQDPQYVKSLAEDILEDVVFEGSIDCVREATQELASTHMVNAAQFDVIMDMVSEIVQENGPQLVEEAVFEGSCEDFLEEEVVCPEVYDMLRELALETLQKTSSKVRLKHIDQLNTLCGERQADSLSLDYLLSMVARQGNLWTEGEHANRLMDDMMLTVLIEQLFNVDSRRNATSDNKPLRRLHEKIFADIANDVLLEELGESLDEDLADLDEYERGLNHPDVTKAPTRMQKFLWQR